LDGVDSTGSKAHDRTSVTATFGRATTVAPGTAVTWINNDEEPHNIVNVDPEQPRLFRSQGLEDGDKYTFLFAKAGTYKYICSVHPRMEGTIVVR
jgi:plastocyanin